MRPPQDIRAGWVWAVLVITVVLLFHRLLLGEVLFWGLPSLQFYPWRWFAFEELSNGRIPYWNPYNGGGAPLIANYQSAIFYPPNWLYVLLPSAHTMGLIALLHVFGSAYGMFLFGDALKMSTFGRGISMISFALGSYLIGRLGSFPTAQAAAWLPWLFWGTHQLLENKTIERVGILGLIVGMQLLAGHAQTTWYSLLAVGLYALWFVFVYFRFAKIWQRLEALLLTGVAMILGAGMAAWQLFLTFELLNQSQRSEGVDFETLTNLSYAPLRSLTLWLPNLFGTPVDGSYLTPDRGVYFEDAAYIGFIPMVAAIFALLGWLKWRKWLTHHQVFRSVPFWYLLALFGFVLAMGKFTPVYRILYDYVPTFDNFREPVRWLIWTAFALSVLAGIGVHHWERTSLLLFWTRLAIAGSIMLIVSAGVGYVYLAPTLEDPKAVRVLATALIALGCWGVSAGLLTLHQPSPNTLAIRWWQLAVFIVVGADLLWANWGLNPTVSDTFYTRDYSINAPDAGRIYWFEDYEETLKFDHYFDLSDYRRARERWTEVRTSLLPNINILDRVFLFNNFDPLQPNTHVEYVKLIEELQTQSSALLRAAGVSMVYGDVQPIGWLSGQKEHVYVSPQDTVPFAWVVPEGRWVESDTAAITQLRAPSWNPEQVVILQEHQMPETSASQLSTAEVQVVNVEPTRQQYLVSSDGAGYLVLANTWYSGWQARVDGVPVQLYRANLTFMAIPISAGDSEITLTYSPRGGEVALAVSLLSTFILISLIAIGLFNTNEQQRLTT
ncbi:MAG: hypothetical protein CUN55_02460 [Phototrophicales bacterium]|nr:MAG: hypothetical protein CUN55_02460 [Phototrophicales bacterium]